MELTQTRAAKYIRYEPETGNFYWIADTHSRGPSKIGEKAGCFHGRGYVRIVILGHKMYAHRLAWLLTHGHVPREIDHINGNPSDNRLRNLREVTRTQNNANRDGVRGYYESRGKFHAKIESNGVSHYLGSFEDENEAQAAYHVAANKLFGEFAKINRPLNRRF